MPARQTRSARLSRSTNRPTTRFVASFVGTLNVLDAVVTDQTAGLVRIGEKTIAIKETIRGKWRDDPARHASRAGSLAEVDASTVQGEVTSSQFLGSVIRTRINLGGKTLSFDTFNDPVQHRQPWARTVASRSTRQA